MVQTEKTQTTLRHDIVSQMIRLENMNLPDESSLTNKRLLGDLTPDGWTESVYEYNDFYIVNLIIDKSISRLEEFEVTNIIVRELGLENIVLPNITQNTLGRSIINIKLKKPNYEINS